jgi:hypothetical protein
MHVNMSFLWASISEESKRVRNLSKVRYSAAETGDIWDNEATNVR